MQQKVAVIIPAGGSGTRMGLAMPKQFHELAGDPIIILTVQAFSRHPSISQIIVAAPEDHFAETKMLIEKHQLPVDQIVIGGKTRQHSVAAGLEAVNPDTDIVLVHDAARPLVTKKIISDCLASINKYGAAIAAIPVTDTLKSVVNESTVQNTVDRTNIWRAQTPQGARFDLMRQAFDKANQDDFAGTDEAALFEYSEIAVAISAGSEQNIKVTKPQDLHIAEAILMSRSYQGNLKIGHGYDAHRLVAGRQLVLGGVTIPHHVGLAGHSDADVLIHALCDAILGAAGEGDIGRHFPDTDQQYKGISSLLLLEKVIDTITAKGLNLCNADATIVAQQPKLAPYLPDMQMNLAQACRVEPGAINIKATTTEKMGFVGREEGIAAHAIVLLINL